VELAQRTFDKESCRGKGVKILESGVRIPLKRNCNPIHHGGGCFFLLEIKLTPDEKESQMILIRRRILRKSEWLLD